MDATVEGRAMPGKKQTRPGITVKIWLSIHRQARMVAAHKDMDVSEYLSQILEKVVDKDYQKMVRDLGQAQQQD